jgi:hypothetical protein
MAEQKHGTSAVADSANRLSREQDSPGATAFNKWNLI